ncbi:pentapeptide repeat-containing protein [Phormidesmis sp. 146-12]
MVNQEFLLALLKRGDTISWNRWRSANPQIQNLDLSGVNLRGLKLPPTTVVGHDPKDCTRFCANLRAIDFSGADLGETQLVEADLRLANLKGAKFDNALLNEADFREADLSKVNFHKANLDKANFSKVNLSKANLSQAILSEANFDSSSLEAAFLHTADLMNANLENANLYKAVLAGAWLSGANFRGANLHEANLVAVQARKADFTGAILTGTCLQDWNIGSETKLDGVICEYVYLKLDQQERRPSSGIFAPGEFTALFQKALETVDLIFADGIDWQAFFQSFQELRSQYDNISIQAIEKKSGGAFVIRLEVPEGADKAAIERQAKELYEVKVQLLETQYQQQLKNVEIEGYRRENTNLLGIVNLLGSRPINAIAIAESQLMGDRNIYMGSGNYNENIGGDYIQGNYINMSQDLAQAAQQIQDLLQQLQNQGVTVEESQQQVATDMAKQAESNPAMMGKLVLWGKAMANKASETTVSEAAKVVFTLVLKAAGLPLP